jgi:hypothetical protein
MNKWLLAATHTLAAGAGFGVAYLVLKGHFEAIADEEIESVKAHYKAVYKDGPVTTEKNNMPQAIGELSPEKLLELKERLESGNYISDSPTPPEHEQVLSIFDDDAPDELVVLNQLLANREHDLPYVITFTEWQENESRFEQHTLTYWESDNTLSDADEQIIPDITGTIGGALSYFGIGSEDKDTVYVRIESSQVDLEIVRDPRSYAKVVHDVDQDEEPRVERIDRMRGDD